MQRSNGTWPSAACSPEQPCPTGGTGAIAAAAAEAQRVAVGAASGSAADLLELGAGVLLSGAVAYGLALAWGRCGGCGWLGSSVRRQQRDRLGDEEGAVVQVTASALLAEHWAAASALSFLVFVAVSKTLLTKLVFKHVATPVAYSVLSCVATNLCLVPIFMAKMGTFKYLDRSMLSGFALVCLAIAGDLAFTNVALNLLSVAFQQCIKSASPAATMLVEKLIKRSTEQPAVLWATVLALCVGPILTGLGSDRWDSSPVGIAMMVAAVFAGAFKYVLAHKMVTTYKNELGTLSFLFWVECFVAALLTPWAVANGEMSAMLFDADRPLSQWLLLYFTAAYGGVRVYSQFYFLSHTSATSLSLSNLAVQALTILLGVLFFGTPVTPYLVGGVVVTLAMSAVYTWLKIVELPARKAAAAARRARAATVEIEEFGDEGPSCRPSRAGSETEGAEGGRAASGTRGVPRDDRDL